MTVEALLKHPALWKGRQQHEKRETFSTGHTELDAALPSGGWPVGALTELMVAHEGVGEFTLLLPALAALTQQQQWIALVAPPYTPYAPALVNAGVALERLLVINCDDPKDAYWTTEQLLRSAVFSSVVLWAEKSADERRQRRLQLAAEQGKAWAVCYRPHHAARTSSPAGLRIVLQHNNQHLQADIIKNRGGRLSKLQLNRSNKGSASKNPGNINPGNINRGNMYLANKGLGKNSPEEKNQRNKNQESKSTLRRQAGFKVSKQVQTGHHTKLVTPSDNETAQPDYRTNHQPDHHHGSIEHHQHNHGEFIRRLTKES